jgi:fructokinase
MNTRPLLVGIGEILWDMLPGGKQLGGAPANFAYQANALGGRGVVASRVGADDLGREILARLDTCQIDRRFVSTDPDHPTGTVDVRVDQCGIPEYVIHQDVAWDHLQITPDLLALAPTADCVCYGTLAQRGEESRKAIVAFLNSTRADCLRVLDINLRQNFYSDSLISDLLNVSRVLKLNDAELPVVGELLNLGTSERDVINKLFRHFDLTAIALTRGAHGSAIFTPDRAYEQPAVSVKIADTVGAGDAFTAAMALGMCAGLEMGKTGELAARAAAFVCSQHGAMPSMPSELRIIPS